MVAGMYSLAILLTAALSVNVQLSDTPQTLPGIGAGQGVRVIDDKAYFYGDKDIGVVRETVVAPDGTVTPTGRDIQLTRRGEDVLSHPTGLAFHPEIGCFIGSTVARKGTICFIDWPRALADGNLDNAVLNTLIDDAAVNGTRPEFVRVGNRWLIATSDYGDAENRVRLYDPEKLKTASRTSEPGVLVDSFPCDSFVQDIAWIDSAGLLVLVQNTTEGLGWRLTFVDLEKSLAASKSVVVGRFDLAPTDELEGFDLLPSGLAVLVSASGKDNVRSARVEIKPGK
jgi:hypothetical protein